jgi:hypothetical protein
MWKQKLMPIMWPAFLAASVLEVGVFALVDPADLHWLGHPLGLSRQGIYTVSFFVFWGGTLLSSALTVLLMMPDDRSGAVQLSDTTDC